MRLIMIIDHYVISCIPTLAQGINLLLSPRLFLICGFLILAT